MRIATIDGAGASAGGGAGTGNPFVDVFTSLATIWAQDRAAERAAPLDYAEWQQRNLMGIDSSQTQNPNAPSGGLIGGTSGSVSGGVGVKTEYMILGGLVLLGVVLAVR